MPKTLSAPVGLYFEDLEAGDSAKTMARTITEADIMNFIGVSGIFEELHLSLEYIREHSIFGKRIAPGPLTFVVAEGLAVQLGLFHHTGMAFLGVEHLTWKAPVFCNDTIHVEMQVLSKRETSKPDRGIVTFRHTVRKQTGEVVMEMEKIRMIRRKAATNVASRTE